jgi:O-antigen/teichoic acid export membrane protein
LSQEQPSGIQHSDGQGLRTGYLITLLARNARVLAAADVVTRLAAIAVAIVLARGLGAHEYGRYVVAVAFASLLGFFVELGTGSYLVREGAQKPQLLGRTTGLVLALRAALGLAVVVVATFVPPLLGYERTTSLAIALFTTAAALRLVGATFLAALQALERLRDVAALQAQQAAVGACAAVGVIALGGRLVAVSLVAVAVSAVSVPWSWGRLAAAHPGSIELPRGDIRPTLPIIASFSSVMLFFTAITYLDSLLVQAFLGDAETGLYGAASRIMLALFFIPTLYSSAVNRSLSRLASSDRDVLTWLHSRVVRHLIVAALPLAVFGLVGSRALLDLLYGEPYSNADTALALLLASLVFSFPAWIGTTTAFAIGAERHMVPIVAASLALNIAGNLLAIPLWGIEGAAAVNVVTEGCTAVLVFTLLRSRGVLLNWTTAVLKPAIAIAPSALIVAALADASLAIRLAIGAAVYVGGLFVLRTFDAHDLAFLRTVGGIGETSGRVGLDR